MTSKRRDDIDRIVKDAKAKLASQKPTKKDILKKRLISLNLTSLTSTEEYVVRHKMKTITKSEAIRSIINNYQGRKTNFSPTLRAIYELMRDTATYEPTAGAKEAQKLLYRTTKERINTYTPKSDEYTNRNKKH